jgi:tetratricopeptide (TPR) repeat protein
MRRTCLAVILSAPLIAGGAYAASALAVETAGSKRVPDEKSGNIDIAAYVITLDVSGSPELRPWKPLPPALRDRRLYIARRADGIRKRYLLNLGFFARRVDAETARKLLLSDYPSAAVVGVTREEESESAKTAIGAPPTPMSVTPFPAGSKANVATNPDADRDAAPLMSQAREELTRGENAAAIAVLDKLLRLPPNRFSQDAQEYIGLAHQRNGEIGPARKEYELYLRLYPDGEGADRVRQRLAALTTATAAAPLKAPTRKEETQTLVYGGLSQYYYHGASKIETATFTPTTVDRATLSQADQSSLVTNLDITHRTRTEDYDNRIVFRDTRFDNFLPGVSNDNRLNAAYYELKNRKHDYMLRLGRQPGYGGGVLGRFDGLSTGIAVSPKWHVNVVAGEPVDWWSIDSRRYFYGFSVDAGTFAEHWSSSLYTIKQMVDGVVDRQAVGTEIRYFDPRKSVYTLLDYDTAFKTINTALVQANWTVGTATVFNLLADHRKSPALQLTNALIGESTTSIDTLLQTRSYDELKQQARDLTATSDLYLLGVTHPLSTKWQVGGNVQQWRISATQGSATQPPTPDTGNVHMYTLQAIATGFFARRDITVASISLIDAPNYNGDSASITNRARITDKWTLDTALRWYRQQDNLGTRLDRITPTFRAGYQWSDRVTFEAEIGIENSTTQTATTDDVSRRRYWSLGYRWDF